MFSKKLRWPKNFRALIRNDRTYILPSSQGWKFSFLLLVLLLIGLIYNNNLTLGLCFLLSGWFFIVMLMSHENLRGVKLQKISMRKAFADDEAEMDLVFFSGKSLDRRYDLEVEGIGFKGRFQLETLGEEGFQLRTTELKLERGVHKEIRLRLKSEFPFGLFRPWKVFKFQDEFVVAPSKKLSADPTFNKSFEEDREFSSFHVGKEKRLHQIVDWKATTTREVVNGSTKVFREFTQPEERLLVFDWETTPGEREERLSRLTSQVYDAFNLNRAYQLRLPHWQSEKDLSPQNYKRCLYELAVFPKN